MEYKINMERHDIKNFIKQIIENEFKIDYWDKWLEEQNYESLSVKPNLLVSCEDKDELIGICSVKIINDKECYLNSFYVAKEYRKNGIGSHLYDICEKYAKENNYTIIQLVVDPVFKDAIRFYEKRNYIFDRYDDKRKELHYHKNIIDINLCN